MKVLYCNPIALDYRIPFYKKLVELFEGEFYFLYSENRYKLSGRDALLERLKETLGKNAIAYKEEKIFNTYTRSFSKYSSERGKRIPLLFGLTAKIKEVKPNVLVTEGFFQWTPLLQLYGLIHGIPVFVGYERTPWTERNNSKLKTWIRKMQDKLIRGYLVNGSETKKYLMSIGVKEEKIHIGGMSADSEGLRKGIKKFQKDSKSYDEFKWKFKKDKGFVYLFCGQIVERKGVGYLLEAWKEHITKYVNDTLVIVGTGNLFNDYKAEYATYDSIHFEGAVPYNVVCRYYSVADVFVLPTTEDNWSLVIPEAMSCGLPVATSIYNGCHMELIEEGVNGYTFDTFRKETIIEALNNFHGVDIKAMGIASIRREEQWNTDHCAQREYEGIMKGMGLMR